jgi:hypothetical protein
MNKYLFAMTVLTAGFSTNHLSAMPTESGAQAVVREIVDFVNVYDLSEDMLQQLLSGNLSNIAVEFPEHAQLPLNLFLDGDLISLVNPEGIPAYIKFNRSIYVRNLNGTFLFSTDLQQWRCYRDFFGRVVHAGFQVDPFVGPVISLGAELNEKPAQ